MRISDWSSDVCSSDLKNLKAFCFGGGHALVERLRGGGVAPGQGGGVEWQQGQGNNGGKRGPAGQSDDKAVHEEQGLRREATRRVASWRGARQPRAFARRSEEHTSELQSLMRISYAVFCLKKKN